LSLTHHDVSLFQSDEATAMAELTADVQAHWTRPGVLARIDAALTELGHDPQNLSLVASGGEAARMQMLKRSKD
jgi:hypothetical protein